MTSSRARDLAALAGQSFDLVVVGGGITGAGIARDAALRGLRVALVDKSDFASGTSSKSSKLVHGGLRYLQQAQLRLVFEGTNERALLMKLAPHLVRPLEFLIPAYRRSFLAMIATGLWIYDLLALKKPPAGHRRLSAREAAELEPALRREHLVGALCYYDCATDDARLTLENLLDARALGAVCASYVHARGPITRTGGRLAGVLCEDARTGERFPVQARVVAAALGPWTDEVLPLFGAPRAPRRLRPTKGVHLIVDAARLPVRRAVTMAARDERIVFAIPADRRTILGTTDTDYRGDYDAIATTLEDVVYLLATANFYFPQTRLRPDDVIASYAGLRPLIAAAGSASAVPREHEVFTLANGLVAIAGGKLTTYRRMAREVVDRVVGRLDDMGFGESARPCQTETRLLPGAFPAGDDLATASARLASAHNLPPEVAEHLCKTYGALADEVVRGAPAEARARVDPELPYLWCEIDRAIAGEQAITVSDVLLRRVPLGLFARDQGVGVAAEVALRLAAAHALAPAESARQLAEYDAARTRSLGFRAGRAAEKSA
jgi:glycerol-3-phosphate dehydrogenase